MNDLEKPKKRALKKIAKNPGLTLREIAESVRSCIVEKLRDPLFKILVAVAETGATSARVDLAQLCADEKFSVCIASAGGELVKALSTAELRLECEKEELMTAMGVVKRVVLIANWGAIA